MPRYAAWHTPSAADRADQYFAAVEAGDVDLVRILLDEEPTLLATVSGEGVRAPLTALYAGHPALADELAARSEPLDVHEASAFDDNGRLRILLAEDPGWVRAWSVDGWQPLHLAAYFGRVEAVRQLLDLDAPVDDSSRNPMRVTAAARGRGRLALRDRLAAGRFRGPRRRPAEPRLDPAARGRGQRRRRVGAGPAVRRRFARHRQRRRPHRPRPGPRRRRPAAELTLSR